MTMTMRDGGKGEGLRAEGGGLKEEGYGMKIKGMMDLGEGMRNTGRDWITDTVFGILYFCEFSFFTYFCGTV